MTTSPLRRFFAWIFDHLLWDPTGSARSGFAGAVWATRKVLMALAAAVFLTWHEWIEHHPRQIILAAFLHFAFVLTAIGLLVYSLRRHGRAEKKSLRGQPNRRGER
jgi:hypothetical protein